MHGELSAHQDRWRLKPDRENITLSWQASGYGTFKDSEEVVSPAVIVFLAVDEQVEHRLAITDRRLRPPGECVKPRPAHFGRL